MIDNLTKFVKLYAVKNISTIFFKNASNCLFWVMVFLRGLFQIEVLVLLVNDFMNIVYPMELTIHLYIRHPQANWQVKRKM